MKKLLIHTLLFVTLPFATLQAESNLTINNPFANDPIFKHFQKLHEEMNKVFEQFNQEFLADVAIAPNLKTDLFQTLASHPKSDFVDRGDHYELTVELPGMDPKSIDINVHDNLISIHAKSEQKKEEKKGDKIIHQERFYGEVQRTLSLPHDANPEKYTTEYKNGILTVNIEKKE